MKKLLLILSIFTILLLGGCEIQGAINENNQSCEAIIVKKSGSAFKKYICDEETNICCNFDYSWGGDCRTMECYQIK